MRLDSQQLDSYIFQERLGRSQTSEVWKAYDSRLQRQIIFKFLLTSASAHDGALVALHSFQQDAAAIVALHHSGIATSYEARILPPQQENTRRAYLMRDYVEGLSLTDYIHMTSHTGKPPAAAELVHLFAEIGLALDYAHQHNVLHGSLKPNNILLLRHSHSSAERIAPIITDIGVNALLKATTHAPVRRSLDTLLYLSPEQAKGSPESPQSDLYSLGILLYEVCTGKPPFQGNRPVALLTQHVNAQPTPPHLVNPHLPLALTQVILKSIAKDPKDRFGTASAMAVALADALSVPFTELPGPLRQQGELAQQKARAVNLSSTATVHSVSPGSFPYKGTDTELNGTTRPIPSTPMGRGTWHRKQRTVLIVCAMLILVTLITSALGTFALFHRNPSPQTPIVGYAFFQSSGQLNEHTNTQGINDELQIDLSGLTDPGPGYSYYAWLLPDTIQTEAPPILLGRLPIQQGRSHFLYVGGKSHLNLLSVTSRFLITREVSAVLPTVPPPDTRLWSYYAEIPQAASPADTLHFSMLGHFRHLLVESPELQARGLHGGLVLWLVQTTQHVSDLANTARDAWQAHDMKTTRKQLILLLDALDGKDLVRTDLPKTVPLLADPHTDQIPLLGLKPANGDPPGYSYGDDVPPGYVYLISLHLSGALLSPETTPAQRIRATQINAALNTVDHWLAQAHDDAKQLVLLSPAQLSQPSSLALLNDLVTQGRAAYTGQISASTGQSQGGVLWIASNIQRLIDFVVTPYKATN